MYDFTKNNEKLKNSYWYFVKQNPNFSDVGYYGIKAIKKFKKNNGKENIKKYMNIDTDSRYLNHAYHFGLLNGHDLNLGYDKSRITEVGNKYYETERELRMLSDQKIKLTDQQIEKIKIDFPQKANNKTKIKKMKFNIFPATIFYYCLIKLIRLSNSNKNISRYLTKDEYNIFVSRIRHFCDCDNMIKKILDYRKMDDKEKDVYDTYKTDSRMINALKQLSAIKTNKEHKQKYTIFDNSVETIREKLKLFSKHDHFFEQMSDDEYFSMLDSDISLWDYPNKENNFAIGGKNELLYGAPGTGKSYKLDEQIKKVYPKDSNMYDKFVFRTTFYEDYSYYDFVGDIKPVKKGNDISYEFSPGIFTLSLATAINNPQNKVYLVIEEMSRGNSETIFGDVFQLLDRDNKGKSIYKIDNQNILSYLKKHSKFNDEKIYIPSNLYILGTANSSDQNTFIMDTAFKRRFNFKYMSTIPLSKQNDFKFDIGGKQYNWNNFYCAVNKFIIHNLKLSEDKQIGQWFIIGKDNVKENNEMIEEKLLNYLWEDVYKISRFQASGNIFKNEYESFYDLKNDFHLGKNIFNDGLMKRIDEIDE